MFDQIRYCGYTSIGRLSKQRIEKGPLDMGFIGKRNTWSGPQLAHLYAIIGQELVLSANFCQKIKSFRMRMKNQ